MDTQTEIEPETKPKPRSHTKNQEKSKLDLNIPEKLFILTIDDGGAAISSVKTSLRYELAGAMLVELALINKIQLKDNRLVLVDPAPSSEPLLGEILAMIPAEKKLRKLSHWLQIVGNKQIIKSVAGRLAEHNVIVIEKKQYSWVIPYQVSPRVNASAKYWVKQHLRGVVLAGEQAEPADIALLSLLKAFSLMRLVFTRDERKSANKKVDGLAQGEVFGDAVAKLLAEIGAAAVTAAG